MCRFGGHTTRFLSVAQHSVQVSRLVRPEYALLGLLHDASEAYTSDVPSPWKANLMFTLADGRVVPFREAERRIQDAVFSALKVSESEPAWKQVKLADAVMLAAEARQFMPHSTIPFPPGEDYEPFEAWSPVRAKAEFMCRYYELTE